MTNDPGDSGRGTLELSRGWIWRVQLTGNAGDVIRIDQSHSDVEVVNAIEFPVKDLRWVAHWLRGSYSSMEWSSHRKLRDGTELEMHPDPKPELTIIQHRA